MGATAALPSDQFKVCAGLADVEPKRWVEALRQAGGGSALRHFADRLDDSDHARAVALVLRMEAKRLDSGAAAAAATCVTGDCFVAQFGEELPMVQGELDQLADLATRSRDPRVFELARDQCDRRVRFGAVLSSCARLSARQWIERDRDNAVPWLALAQEEPAARDEALFQAARARTIDAHHGAAWIFLDRVDRNAGPASMAVIETLLHLGATGDVPTYSVITQHCDEATLRDANRRQRCDALARLLTGRGRTVMDFAIGSVLAERLGWSDAAALRAEHRALFQVLLDSTQATDAETATSRCQVALGPLVAHIARDGELRTSREHLRASGRSVAQWAALADARASEASAAYARAAASAAQAAAAASAASAAR